MSVGGATESKSTESRVSDARGAAETRRADSEAVARAELSDAAEAVSDADVDAVESRMTASEDGFDVGLAEAASTSEVGVGRATATDDVVPVNEPTVDNRAMIEGYRDQFAEIDALENDLSAQSAALEAGDPRTAQDRRAETLDALQADLAAIEDPAERERATRAIAVAAGHQAGRLAGRSPHAAYERLDALGAGMTPETGALLSHGALSTPAGADSFPPLARSGSSVGDALSDVGARRREAMGQVARAVVPGADAAARAVEGDYAGAVGSVALDAAGGVLAKGGKLAVAGGAAALALTPTEAEAGVLSQTIKLSKRSDLVIDGVESLSTKGQRRVPDVSVSLRTDGEITKSVRLTDPRAKHHSVSVDEADLEQTAKALSRGQVTDTGVKLKDVKHGQFSTQFNSLEGQAKLAREVLDRVSKADLERVTEGVAGPTFNLGYPVGLSPNGRGKVVVANSVQLKADRTGSFHLVPRP